MEWKISVLPWENLRIYRRDETFKGMVQKGLERELSDDVIVCDLKVVTLIAEILLFL